MKEYPKIPIPKTFGGLRKELEKNKLVAYEVHVKNDILNGNLCYTFNYQENVSDDFSIILQVKKLLRAKKALFQGGGIIQGGFLKETGAGKIPLNSFRQAVVIKKYDQIYQGKLDEELRHNLYGEFGVDIHSAESHGGILKAWTYENGAEFLFKSSSNSDEVIGLVLAVRDAYEANKRIWEDETARLERLVEGGA